MQGPDIGVGENPEWTQAKNDAARLVDMAMTDYENKSLGTRSRPTDANLYVALQEHISDALFKAQNGTGLAHLRR